MQQHNLV